MSTAAIAPRPANSVAAQSGPPQPGPRRLAFLIEPLDTIFCRDGRPFGQTNIVVGGLPQPQTWAGAIRTHVLKRMGVEFNNLPKRIRELREGTGKTPSAVLGLDDSEVIIEALRREGTPEWAIQMRSRGPWLHKTNPGGGRRSGTLLPTPADVMKIGKGAADQIVRLVPVTEENTLAGWEHEHDLLPLMSDRDDELKPAGGYLTPEGLSAYLRGDELKSDHVVAAGRLFQLEGRTGIAVDHDSLTAAKSEIYGIKTLRLQKDVALYAELDLPGLPDDFKSQDYFPDEGWTLRLGGEGKMAFVRPIDPVEWPSAAPLDGNLLLLLATPAAFSQPPYSLPSPVTGRKLISCAVPGYVTISGWDLARGRPRPARHFAQAGSVYLYEQTTASGAVTAGDGCTLCSDIDTALGYGLCLKGTWKYAE